MSTLDHEHLAEQRRYQPDFRNIFMQICTSYHFFCCYRFFVLFYLQLDSHDNANQYKNKSK